MGIQNTVDVSLGIKFISVLLEYFARREYHPLSARRGGAVGEALPSPGFTVSVGGTLLLPSGCAGLLPDSPQMAFAFAVSSAWNSGPLCSFQPAPFPSLPSLPSQPKYLLPREPSQAPRSPITAITPPCSRAFIAQSGYLQIIIFAQKHAHCPGYVIVFPRL